MKITKQEKLELFRKMLLVRAFEEKAGELFQQNLIPGFIHLSIGEEASSVGTCSALRKEDYVASTHRGHGHLIAKGADPKFMFAELFGKATGYCKGKGGSMHIADFSIGMLGADGIVGAGLPIAAGAAMAAQLEGKGNVAAVFFGDGACQEGEFHEVLNLAAIWRLPLLFVCENNLYAMGVPLRDSEAETDLRRKAQAYRMASEAVDGMEPVPMEAAARRAVDHVRSGQGPYFLECRTYRFRAHSMFDTQTYRTRDEIESWKQRDPIERLRAWMRANHQLSDAEAAGIDAAIAADIDDAVAFAEAGTLESVDELERFVLMQSVVQEASP